MEIGRGNEESPSVQLENTLRLLRLEKEERMKAEKSIAQLQSQLAFIKTTHPDIAESL